MQQADSQSAQPRLHLRVFIASPGDVAEERAIARTVIQELPLDPLLRGRITTEPVAWDGAGGAAMEATMIPQEAIERGLPRPSQCDVVVLIMWARMGTPLAADWEKKPDGTPYRSGTEWEYLDAFGAAKRQGRPAVLVYKRNQKWIPDPDAPDFQDRVAQYQLVKAFFAEFRNQEDGSFKGSYIEYDNASGFREVLERDLKAVIGKRLDSQERSGLATARPPEHASAQRELNRLGLLILRLHHEKAIAGVLHDLYTNPSVRQLRIDAAAEIPTCVLGKALACTEGALSSIQDALSSESHRVLADAKQVPNLGEDLERLKAVAQSLATLADGNSAQDRAELRRITRYFGSTLRDWRDRLNRDAEERWGELGLGDFGTKIQPFRPYLSPPYIAQFDKGYAELTGRPPLFEKCNLLAREHDLLEDVLKQFDMLQGELDIGDLDGDELGIRCDILKDSVAQAHSFWSQYFDLGGSREQWEDKLRSSGKYQWDIINRCQQEMTGAPAEGDASTGNLRFRERLRKAQRNLELHFGSVDNALAQAFGRIKEAIGRTLLTVELVA